MKANFKNINTADDVNNDTATANDVNAESIIPADPVPSTSSKDVNAESIIPTDPVPSTSYDREDKARGEIEENFVS